MTPSSRRVPLLILLPLLLLGAAVSDAAWGQNPVGVFALRQQLRNDAYILERAERRPQRPAPDPAVVPASVVFAAPPVDQTASSVLRYFGNRQAVATLQQLPARQFISSQNTAPATAAPTEEPRPFEAAESSVTVSPYLGLYRDSFDEDAPNYYTFVRPQLQQQQQARRQQLAIERLNRQRLSAAPQTTGATQGARFGDTGQFYGRWAR